MTRRLGHPFTLSPCPPPRHLWCGKPPARCERIPPQRSQRRTEGERIAILTFRSFASCSVFLCVPLCPLCPLWSIPSVLPLRGAPDSHLAETLRGAILPRQTRSSIRLTTRQAWGTILLATWHGGKTPSPPHVLHLGRGRPAQHGQVQSGEP